MKVLTNILAIIAGAVIVTFALVLSALPYAVVLALAIVIVRCTGVI